MGRLCPLITAEKIDKRPSSPKESRFGTDE